MVYETLITVYSMKNLANDLFLIEVFEIQEIYIQYYFF